MKILFLHQFFGTPNQKGSLRAYDICRKMIERRYEVHVITSYSKFSELKKKKIKFKIINGINVHFINANYDNKYNFFQKFYFFFKFSILASIKINFMSANLIYASSSPLTIGIPALIKYFLSRTPYVLELRDLWPDMYVSAKIIKNPIIISLALMLEKILYKFSSKIIVINNEFKKHLTNFKKVNPKKITIIYQFCKIEKVIPNLKNNFLIKKNIKKKKIILYAGGIDHLHDPTYLVKLANFSKNKYNNLCFILIGSGNYFSKVKDLAKKKGVLNNNLFLLQATSKNNLITYLSIANAHISLINKKFHNTLIAKYASNNKFFDSINYSKPIFHNFNGWQTKITKKYKIGNQLSDIDYSYSVHIIDKFINNKKSFIKARKSFNILKSKFDLDKQFKILDKELRKVISG